MDSDSPPCQDNLEIPVRDSIMLPTHRFPLDLNRTSPRKTNAAENDRKFSSEIS